MNEYLLIIHTKLKIYRYIFFIRFYRLLLQKLNLFLVYYAFMRRSVFLNSKKFKFRLKILASFFCSLERH